MAAQAFHPTSSRPSSICALTCALVQVLTVANSAAQTPLRPDLTPLSSYLSNWSVNNLGGNNREIRLSAGNGNAGQGPLHMFGSTIITNPDGTLSQNIIQRIFRSDNSFFDRLMGAFTHHAGHGHFHVDRWNAYRLRIRSNANVGPIVAESFYTSFCVRDVAHFNPGLPGSPANTVYVTCASTQGISVGWNEVLGSSLEGQSINVTGIPNGTYWLEHEADPANVVDELDETNNVTRIAVTLSTMPAVGLRVLSATPVGTVAPPLNAVAIYFNQIIDPATFTNADVTFTGPSGTIAIASITPVNNTTGYRISVARQTTPGAYTVAIGPNIMTPGGTPMDQNWNNTPGEPGDQFFHAFQIQIPCPNGADINCDGIVNVNDLLAVINGWGACNAPCPPSCAPDITGDCTVNVNDLLMVINNWG